MFGARAMLISLEGREIFKQAFVAAILLTSVRAASILVAHLRRGGAASGITNRCKGGLDGRYPDGTLDLLSTAMAAVLGFCAGPVFRHLVGGARTGLKITDFEAFCSGVTPRPATVATCDGSLAIGRYCV